MRVPLAWQNLTHNKRRLALAISGVGFAVLLMFMQLGFRNGMLDSNVAFLQELNADLIIASPARYTLSVSEPFSRRRLAQSLACPGVSAAYPLYIETHQAALINPTDGVARPIRIVAFGVNDPVLMLPEVEAQQSKLRLPRTVLVDRQNRPDFGSLPLNSEVDLAGRAVRVVGEFHLGTDFANDGNLIASPETLALLFPHRYGTANPLDRVDLGLVKLRPGARAREVQQALAELLPHDVHVFLKQEYVDQELGFWRSSTPVGFIFGLGLALGFAVGVVICYQILYTDIADHLAEFATLKAMGYSLTYFVRVVLEEAVWLAVLGFIPGLIVSALAYQGLAAATGLLMELTPARVLLILSLTIGMCVLSGCLAIRRLVGSDPAELFA
jgi:putative ABC transport system permease protein